MRFSYIILMAVGLAVGGNWALDKVGSVLSPEPKDEPAAVVTQAPTVAPAPSVAPSTAHAPQAANRMPQPGGYPHQPQTGGASPSEGTRITTTPAPTEDRPLTKQEANWLSGYVTGALDKLEAQVESNRSGPNDLGVNIAKAMIDGLRTFLRDFTGAVRPDGTIDTNALMKSASSQKQFPVMPPQNLPSR